MAHGLRRWQTSISAGARCHADAVRQQWRPLLLARLHGGAA